MKIAFRIVLASLLMAFYSGCSVKEEPVFSLSDDYLVVSKTPVLKLSDTRFSKTTEGTAILVLSVNDSLSVIDWDLISLTMINKVKGDTLVDYSSYQDNTKTADFENYRTSFEAYLKNLQISLKEGIEHPTTKKIQITVLVNSKE